MKRLILWLLTVVLLLQAGAIAEGAAYESEGCVLTGASGASGEVTVPSEVNGARIRVLGASLFFENADITGITVPEPVAVLDQYATCRMTSLLNVSLPDSLRVIGNGNFYYSYGVLESVTVPAGVLAVGMDSFSYVPTLKSVTFTGPVPAVHSRCFIQVADDFVCYVPADLLEEYRAALPDRVRVESSGAPAVIPGPDEARPEEEFSFSDGVIDGWDGDDPCLIMPAAIGGEPVTTIGGEAFRKANGSGNWIWTLDLPEGLETIGDGAFRDQERLAWVDCPDSVKVIGDYAFRSGYACQRFDWPESLEEIGDGAFFNTYLSGTLALPPRVARIGSNAFYNTGIDTLILPGTEVEIAQDAFERCIQLKQVVLPWNADDAALEKYQALFDGVEGVENVEVVRGEQPEEMSEAAPPAPEDAARFGGMWYLNTLVMDGQEYSAADMGMDLTLQLNEDGSAVLNVETVTEAFWRVDGDNVILSSSGTEIILAPDGDTLSAESDGIKLTFGREPVEPGYVPAEPVAAQTVGEFDGVWEAFWLESYGMGIPVEAYSDEMGSLFGTDTLAIEIRDGAVRWLGAEEAEDWTLDGGRLIGSGKELALLDDGSLKAETGLGTLFLRKADDTAEPGPDPEPETAGPRTGVKYRCSAAAVSGYTFDPTELGGEYSVTFRDNGRADLVLAGAEALHLNWHMAGENAVIDYYGTGLVFVPVEGGYTMDYLGTMDLTFTAD